MMDQDQNITKDLYLSILGAIMHCHASLSINSDQSLVPGASKIPELRTTPESSDDDAGVEAQREDQLWTQVSQPFPPPRSLPWDQPSTLSLRMGERLSDRTRAGTRGKRLRLKEEKMKTIKWR